METNQLGHGLTTHETWVPDEDVHMTESLSIEPSSSLVLVNLCIEVRERYRKGLWEKIHDLVAGSAYFTVKRSETGYVFDIDGTLTDLYLGEDPFLIDYSEELTKLSDSPRSIRHAAYVRLHTFDRELVTGLVVDTSNGLTSLLVTYLQDGEEVSKLCLLHADEEVNLDEMSDHDFMLYVLTEFGLDGSELSEKALKWVRSTTIALSLFSGIRLITKDSKVGLEIPSFHTFTMPDDWVCFRDELDAAAGSVDD